MYRMVGLAVSLILHILIIFFIFYKSEVNSPPKETENLHPIEVTLLSKSEDKPITSEGEGLEISSQSDDKICSGQEKEYIGIGIIHSLSIKIIIYAPTFYPGYKAGLREGDIIVSFDKIGDYVYTEVMRDKKHYKYKIKMEKICYMEHNK